MTTLEVLMGLPMAGLAIAIGIALLVNRQRLGSSLSRRARNPDDTGALIAMVAFFLGSCLSFVGTGTALFVLIRAFGGISYPS